MTTPTSSRPTQSRATTGPLRSLHSTTTKAVRSSGARCAHGSASHTPTVGAQGSGRPSVLRLQMQATHGIPIHDAGGCKGLDWLLGSQGPRLRHLARLTSLGPVSCVERRQELQTRSGGFRHPTPLLSRPGSACAGGAPWVWPGISSDTCWPGKACGGPHLHSGTPHLCCPGGCPAEVG